jgi:hypothetical protein
LAPGKVLRQCGRIETSAIGLLKIMKIIITDGGRVGAGYKAKDSGDCVCRAISIATQKDYQEVYDSLNYLAKSERPRKGKKRSSSNTGVYKQTIKKYMQSIGWTWVPTMTVGSGCKVHLKKEELPTGRLVVSVSKHLVAVVDGVIYDNHDPSRGGTRCVYGYWFFQG